MIRPTAVEPREGYRIWLRYSDGTAGEIDLSPLVGQGVFAAWQDRACFAGVRLAEHGAIVWEDDLKHRRHPVFATDRQAAVGNNARRPGAGQQCLKFAGAAELSSANPSTPLTANP